MLALAALYLVAEIAGGLFTGSLALLADAGHMASDVASLALALLALWLVDRPSHAGRTFGWQRFEILAALANGVALVLVAVFIVVEALERLSAPPEVKAGPMLVVATGGLLVNVVGMLLLHGQRSESLNLRAAWWHLASDALGSVGAMASGAAMLFFDFRMADPIASLAIAGLVAHGAFGVVREAVDVLLETAPSHLDVEEIGGALADVPGVVSVHDLHVWTITSGLVSLSCHVQCADGSGDARTLGALQALLRTRFGIHHATIQLEPEDFEETGKVC